MKKEPNCGVVSDTPQDDFGGCCGDQPNITWSVYYFCLRLLSRSTTLRLLARPFLLFVPNNFMVVF